MKKLLTILPIILISCNSIPKNSVVIKNFPYTTTLKGDSVTFFDEELGIMGFNDAGNFILCSSHGTEYHYSVYTKDSHSKVGDILKEGRGPEEFIAPDYFSQYKIKKLKYGY